MSRVATQTQPTPKTAGSTVQVPHDRIAMRAYEKWMKRGCQHGCALQDWMEAESELAAELARGTPNTMRR